jgi:glycosyltransferase involved in cell wall biosynthesis
MMPCKTVVTIHDILYEILPDFFPIIHRHMQRTLIPRFARRADAVITVSEYSRRLLLDLYGLEQSKVFVTTEAAAPNFRLLGEGGCDVLNKYGIDRDYILYVGRIAPIKNIPGMLDAFANAQLELKEPIKFVLVGTVGNLSIGRFLEWYPDQ